MRGDMLGVERRRRWSDEDKLSVVLAVGVDGVAVTQVAQRYEVTRQQIYTWRKALERKGLWHGADGAVFLPFNIPASQEAGPAVNTSESKSDLIEIALTKGRQLRVSCGLDDAALSRLIRVVERA